MYQLLDSENYFNSKTEESLQNIYSDKYVEMEDFVYNNVDKMYTVIKPFIWTNRIMNLHTGRRLLENSKYNYTIGINLVYTLCTPFMLFKIFPKKEISARYNYKIRPYRDILNLGRTKIFELESKLTDEVDYINKVIGYDPDELDIIFSECTQFGKTDSGKKHEMLFIYFKEKPDDSYIFLVQYTTYSDRVNKEIVRSQAFRITNMGISFGEKCNLRQPLTVRRRGFLVGDYEHNVFGFKSANKESIDILYRNEDF